MAIPYITNARLVATRTVEMNSLGSLMYLATHFPPKTPCLLRSSMRSLLAEIKAISIPEKKPIVLKQRSTIIQELSVGLLMLILSRCTERGSGI